VVAAFRGADAAAMSSRTAGAALFGALVGAWIGRALFKWILGVEGLTLVAAIVAVAVVGGVICFAAEQQSARPPDHP
jgi:hypothetical protein